MSDVADDPIVPKHYGGAADPYEVIKVMRAWLTPEEYIGALKFNIHKYNARAGKKGAPLVCFQKAQFYQNELVRFVAIQDEKQARADATAKQAASYQGSLVSTLVNVR